MADALGPEGIEGVPDRLSVGRLTGVGERAQPSSPSTVEVRLELGPRDLGSAQTEADERLGTVVERVAEGRVRGLEPGLAGDVVDPLEDDAVVSLGGSTRVLDRLRVGLDRDPHPHAREGRHRQLGVANLLCRKAFGDLVGQEVDVLGRAQQPDDGQVDVDEVTEVRERVEVAQRLDALWHTGIRVPLRQPGDSLGPRRADVVDVQLCLRQPCDEFRVCRPLTHAPKSASHAVEEVPTLGVKAARASRSLLRDRTYSSAHASRSG